MKNKLKSFKYDIHFFKVMIYFLFTFFNICDLNAQEIILSPHQTFPLLIGKKISILNDNREVFKSTNIFKEDFKKSSELVPILASPHNNIWIRFKLKNNSNYSNLYLSIDYADISTIKLYKVNDLNSLVLVKEGGNAINFNEREKSSVNYNFLLPLQRNEEKYFY